MVILVFRRWLDPSKSDEERTAADDLEVVMVHEGARDFVTTLRERRTVMVAFWPFAHDAPLANPLLAIASGHGSGLGIQVRYLGAVQPSSGLPGH